MSRLFAIDDALDSDAWYTPPWVFDGLGVEFDLDVAAPAEPLEWVPARQRYTVADDGLLQPWFGLVWCNPPYSAPTAWCRRWAQHPDGFLLIRADLSTGGPFVAVFGRVLHVRPGQAHPVRERPRLRHRRRQLLVGAARPWRHRRRSHRPSRRNPRRNRPSARGRLVIAREATERWRAWCPCGWRSPVVADQTTAPQALEEHDRTHDDEEPT